MIRLSLGLLNHYKYYCWTIRWNYKLYFRNRNGIWWIKNC